MATLVKRTVKPSGGDHADLNAAFGYFETNYANFVTADIYGEIEISGDWSAGADTGTVQLSGVTTDATHYLHIYTSGAARHAGVWDSDCYILQSPIGLRADGCNYLRIEGLQIVCTDDNQVAGIDIFGTMTSGNNGTWIDRCLIKGPGTNNSQYYGIYNHATNGVLYVYNTIVYGIGKTANQRGIVTNATNCVNHLYSCTVIGGALGIRNYAGATYAKNCYAGDAGTECFERNGSTTLTKTNCASSDTSATDNPGSGETATDCEASVAYSTATFSNVTGGTENFQLAAGSGLIDQGVDTSGESAPLNFTIDIAGTTRSGTWEIGAFTYAAAGLSIPVAMHHYRQHC